MNCSPLGDSAVTIEFDDRPTPEFIRHTAAIAATLWSTRPPGVLDVVPVYGSVTIHFDPTAIDPESEEFIEWMKTIAGRIGKKDAPKPRTIQVPVCYAHEHAPDLRPLADRHGISEQQLIELHSGATYSVGAVGFLPGFAYLLGLPRRLHTPRLHAPRPRVPPGSVGIGASQTGVYPGESPGGWHLIGRTPMQMFDPAAVPASLLQVGDQVIFRPISAREFAAWK